MSKLSLTLRRRLILLSMGGSTFFFLGGLGSDFPNCWTDAQNRDIATLYQTVGNQSIAARLPIGPGTGEKLRLY